MKSSYFSVHFSLKDFKSLTDAAVGEKRFGPTCVYAGLKWNMMAVLKASSPTRRLGLYLQCAGDGSSDTWTYKAEIILRVVNYSLPSSDIVKRTGVRTFNKKEFDWGFNEMADISGLMDESKGFLKNDAILFSADVFPQ